MMAKVVSFRPSEMEERLIERVRRRHRFKNRTEAVRYLLRQAERQEEQGGEGMDPLLSFRVPREYRWRKKASITSKEIDESVYGDSVWPGE